MTEQHEHQFPECDQDGTLVTFPCLLCGLPVGDALKLAAEDRQEADRLLAARDAEDAAANSDVGDILAKYEQSLAEKDAQIADITELWNEVGRHLDAASIGWNHPQVLAVFTENRRLHESLREKDAQIAALQEWRNAALRVGEDLALDGPNGYYSFTASQYLNWALARLRETPAPPEEPQDPRYKHILSGDYYMPGHKHETKESETHMTDPIIDVQTTLDDWLASNPEAQKYVRKIYYVPDGAQIPRDVTHMNRLTSIDYPDLELRLGVVATLETAALANLILGMIERSAPDPKA
jgi:hypothetical protein